MAQFDDETLERVSKALYNEFLKQAIAGIEAISVDHTRLTTVTNKLYKESDRSCAILLYSVLDEALCEIIMDRCDQEIGELKNRLFGTFGLLPTSANRLFLVFALKWITRSTFHNCNLIRKIRNEFAHNVECDSFRNAKIKGLLSSIDPIHCDEFAAVLKVLQEHSDTQISKSMKDASLTEYDQKGRLFFIIEAIFTIDHTVMDLCVLPEAEKYRVSPDDILRDHDKLPKNLKDIRHKATRGLIQAVAEVVEKMLASPTHLHDARVTEA